MASADINSASMKNAPFQVVGQLTVPTVSITDSSSTRLSTSNSTLEEFSSLAISFPKRTDSIKRRTTSDPALPILPRNTSRCFNHNNQSIMTTLNEHVSSARSYQFPRSLTFSSTKRDKSIKKTLFGIWQRLNHEDLRPLPKSSTPSPTKPKHIDRRVKKNTPHWKAFSTVVTSLLTFTRTKKEQYEWIQLVGHPGTFKEGLHDGYVLKQLCKDEQYCCEVLRNDLLKSFVPKYNGIVQDEQGKSFIEMEDLLSSFDEPCIMDCKLGVRTYLEEELDKSEHDPEPRADLYQKMIAIDPTAPTEEEHAERKIVKSRYMIWREGLSSTEDLGFRIEAIKKSRGLMSKEFQRIKEREEVKKELMGFLDDSLTCATRYLERLIDLRSTCNHSSFFQTHELIGTSLLFVHDSNKVSLSMIDFGKTRKLPEHLRISHQRPWIRGSHEDGYLIGLDNLIAVFEEMIEQMELLGNEK